MVVALAFPQTSVGTSIDEIRTTIPDNDPALISAWEISRRGLSGNVSRYLASGLASAAWLVGVEGRGEGGNERLPRRVSAGVVSQIDVAPQIWARGREGGGMVGPSLNSMHPRSGYSLLK